MLTKTILVFFYTDDYFLIIFRLVFDKTATKNVDGLVRLVESYLKIMNVPLKTWFKMMR